MASGGPPETFSDRDLIIAQMFAAGWSNQRVCEHFGLHPSRVSILRNAPAMRAAVSQLQQEMREHATMGVQELLFAEARPTFERIKRLRDQDANLPVALNAATVIFDRVLPKVALSATRNEHVVRFDAGFVEMARAALAEIGETIEVEAVREVLDRAEMLRAVRDEELDA